ncbi:nascent polypeptide-associated complex subunit alpha, muscle-specific form isoform X2 [Drosophila innubila]|uniref:nascent polypeptide-associated complex subunit alpha, muscle-specific form isoform X2 n=1 Tax=Drosophila innubila TaxID=198719 RepID=UPI00148D7645|nr:nascent polypeptide-associated complex subunit alpha, muscle-specific form isoform X2 [Drosophila innubila]
MSERSKGDVSSSSSRVNNNANRIVKNPLLSASVTGLTFDDFPNKPLLLPAAPPVVHAPPPQPTNALIAGILNRESKTLVTVGQSSSIDDNETLDEINLNASSSDDSATAAANASINPYLNVGDGNANPLLEPPTSTDSLLSQAASSFGALPSVASNVFSTFSKRIYAGNRETEEQQSQPQLDIQPTYIQQVGQVPPPVAPFYAAPPTAVGEAAPEPPKFYAPTELPHLGAGPSLPPTSAGQNTYRITARKKLYAPIPGLSEQQQQQQHHQSAQPVAAPFQTPPYPATAQPAVAAFEPPVPAPPVQEERKSGGGLFSLTNLVPTGVLQNISGLVQSATGRATNEPPAPVPAPVSYNAPNPGYFDISTSSGATNYFAPAPVGAVPVATDYFVPTAAPPAVGGFFNPLAAASAPEAVPPPSVGGFFNPLAENAAPVGGIFNPLAVTSAPEAVHLPAVGGFFTPAGAAPPTTAVPPPSAVAPPSAVSQPLFAPQTTAVPPPSAVAPPPTAAPPQAVAQPLLVPPTTSEPPVLGQPPAVAPPQVVSQLFAAPTSVAPPPAVAAPPLTVAAQAAFAQPTAQPPPIVETTTALAPPPVAASSVPPPAAGLTSYRLQKGTRLYKSPLTAQETAPPTASFGQQTGYATPPTLTAPAAIFNPFGNVSSTGVALLAPTTAASQKIEVVPSANSLFTPQSTRAVVPPNNASFFAPIADQGVSLPLHPPAAAQTFPDAAPFEVKSAQEVPLYAAPPTSASIQGVPLFSSFTTETTQGTIEPKLKENASLFAAPQTSKAANTSVDFFTNSTAPSSLFQSEQLEEKITPVSQAEEKEVPSSTAQEASKFESTPLFVPVPSAEGVPLYPPAEISQGIDLALASANQPAVVPPTLNAGSLFAPAATTETQKESTFPAQFAQPPPGIEATSVALTTQTTTTFFNPFAQTITTPLPQDLLPPPIGFVAPDVNQLFEAQTIEPVLPEAEKVTAEAAPPPPPTARQLDTTLQANPFRRSSETVPHPPAAPSPLQSFFTPAGNSSDFNFFASPPKEDTPQPAVGQIPQLPPQLSVAPPPLAAEPPATVNSIAQSSHTLGFEQLISDSQQIQNSNEIVYQNSSVNSFSGYFGGPGEVAPPPTAQPLPQIQLTGSNSGNFFDHFAGGAQGQEDQRIQNFFNNPPLQDQPAAPGELKYDIVHSGLPTKHFEERSQTSVSNLVEPPSSACSDFSTATKGAVVQQSQQEVQPESQLEDLQKLYQGELPEEILQQLRMANEKGHAIAPPANSVAYTPALLHWFYKRSIDGKFVWTPFSHYDSAMLETSLTSDESDSTCIVPVEGGRYDVNIKERTKTPVFWEGKAIEVRRCSWFYKAVDSKYVPYAEETAAALEAEYKRATETGEWLKKIPLANGEQVTMHGPSVIVHFMPPSHADTWGGTVQSSSRPLVVKRDLNDFKIQQGESQRVDHLLFMVHGIGSACDLKMRNVEEVVDDFRLIAQQLVQSHYKNSTDMGLVGRVEVLPIEWHGHLHSEELGIDEKLKSITLESIPRLRHFTNDTLLDVLFYTSPKYCQKIMNTVADALNEVYLKYRMRHPEFNGGVSLAGHSLGSLILFDLLCHQEPLKESEEENKNPDQLPQKHNLSAEPKHVQLPNNDQMLPKQVSYAMGLGPAGTGQPVINYTQLIFHPKKFFALGSPIGMFVTIRGIDKLGLDFRLPTCPGFYNIFHPFDPVAYRIEALVNPDMKGIRPVLIPHHKGRKRMHLELRETMTRVGADIKQRFMDTFKTTLDSVHFLSTVTKVKKEAEESLAKTKAKNSSQEFHKQAEEQDESSVATTSSHARNRTDSESTTNSDPEFIELDFPLGKLNDSKRVDYVLQEAPLEFINEYIFALSSHVCYWASEDTILFVMKEIYAGLGISTDSQVPQQSMTIERPNSRNNSVSQSMLPM